MLYYLDEFNFQKPEANTPDTTTSPKMPKWEQLQARVNYPLVRPSWIIRPAPPPPEENENEEDSGSDSETKAPVQIHPTMIRHIMLKVFSNLPRNDLLSAMLVCRQWAIWSIHHSLWKEISLVHSPISGIQIMGIVRRQPLNLKLDWSQLNENQFAWLLPRLPQLDTLSVEGLSFGVFRSLVSPYCPPLSKLNLSYCEGINDDTLTTLLRPPPYNRPGHRDASSRLRQLTHLKLAGTQVGDSGIAMIVRSLPFLTHLDLSSCLRLTDCAVELLASSSSIVSHSLKCLDLRWCNRLSPLILPSLASLPLICELSLHPCLSIPLKAIEVWGKSHSYTLGTENKMSRPPRKLSTEDPPSDNELGPSQEELDRSHLEIKKDAPRRSKTTVLEKGKKSKGAEKEGQQPKRKKNPSSTQKTSSSKKDSDDSSKEEDKEDNSSSSEEESSNEESKSYKKQSRRGSHRRTKVIPKSHARHRHKTTSRRGRHQEFKEQILKVGKRRKKIITRSKTFKTSQRRHLTTKSSGKITKNKTENSPSTSKKIASTEESATTKSSKSSGTNENQSDKKYSLKLRKKSLEEPDVSSNLEEPRKKRIKESSVPPSKRPRKNSNSSSSSCSPLVLLPNTKKLKIELEPIGKIGKFSRRKSEGQRPSTSSTSSTSSNTAASEKDRDKSTSRDRPERQHRSPRRLSMCQ